MFLKSLIIYQMHIYERVLSLLGIVTLLGDSRMEHALRGQ
jgi:hypothetical protein